MKRLRRRPRVDRSENQPRRPGSALGRRVYLSLLVLLLGGIAHYVAGDRVFLRADGLVVRDQTMLEALVIARVDEVAVRPGQRVRPGDVLLRTGSIEVAGRIADYAIRSAELAEREAARRSRLTVVGSLIPLAEERRAEADRALSGLRGLRGDGLVLTSRYDEAEETRYDATRELLGLTAERNRLSSEIDQVAATRARAEEALAGLETLYAGGWVRSGIEGVIGDTVPSVGEVFLPGDPLLAIHSGEAHVLAYLPEAYLFDIAPGSEVRVTSGRLSAAGRITEILPVSRTLPPAFQNAFKPDRTRQLARIEFETEQPFPTHASVEITRPLTVEPFLARIAHVVGAFARATK